MISPKHALAISCALIIFVVLTGSIQYVYYSTVNRDGVMHMTAKYNESSAFIAMVGWSDTSVICKRGVLKLNQTEMNIIINRFKKRYDAVCGLYKAYAARFENKSIKCEIKNATAISSMYIYGEPCPERNMSIPYVYVAVSYNNTPNNQWPVDYYTFNKTTKGSVVLYTVKYEALPRVLMNYSWYNRILRSKNYARLRSLWGRRYIGIEKRDGRWTYADPYYDSDIITHRLLYVKVPGKIVNVSPQCIATIINDHEVLFNITKFRDLACKDEVWKHQGIDIQDYSNYNITNYSYYIRYVPLTVVSEEPKAEAYLKTIKTNIKTNNSTTQPPNNKSNHSLCATTLILLGVLAMGSLLRTISD